MEASAPSQEAESDRSGSESEELSVSQEVDGEVDQEEKAAEQENEVNVDVLEVAVAELRACFLIQAAKILKATKRKGEREFTTQEKLGACEFGNGNENVLNNQLWMHLCWKCSKLHLKKREEILEEDIVNVAKAFQIDTPAGLENFKISHGWVWNSSRIR